MLPYLVLETICNLYNKAISLKLNDSTAPVPAQLVTCEIMQHTPSCCTKNSPQKFTACYFETNKIKQTFLFNFAGNKGIQREDDKDQ